MKCERHEPVKMKPRSNFCLRRDGQQIGRGFDEGLMDCEEKEEIGGKKSVGVMFYGEK